MLYRVAYFDFGHSVKGFEKMLRKRVKMMNGDLGRRDKGGALATWLGSPFYIFASNLMYERLPHLTKDEDNDMCDHVDTMENYGLSFDDANDELEVWGPSRILGNRLSYKHIRRFMKYILTHQHQLAERLYKDAHNPDIVPEDQFNEYMAMKSQDETIPPAK